MEDPVYLCDENVLTRMLKSEARQLQCESCFESGLQIDFSEEDRCVLAKWMRDVCEAEECQADIFPLSCQIVDKFLSLVRTKRGQLQLLGAVALLLASKLRQTQQIPAKHLIYYTKDLINLNELRTWELFVLTTLKWDLALITPVDYLDIFLRSVFPTSEQLMLDEAEQQRVAFIEDEAHRLIYECCLDYKYSFRLPSVIASTCLARAMAAASITTMATPTTTTTTGTKTATVPMSIGGCFGGATSGGARAGSCHMFITGAGGGGGGGLASKMQLVEQQNRLTTPTIEIP